MPGNPYDGHTLATVILAIETLLGNTLERIVTYDYVVGLRDNRDSIHWMAFSESNS